MTSSGNEEVFLTSAAIQDTSLVERAVKKSLFLVFFLAFLGGILTSFTPCVYPMIPATVAIFGAKEVKSKLMACSLAATYIIGVALSYASLGVLAAAIGTVFGNMMENPWLISIVAAFYVVLALSMLDVFVFYLPSSWVSAASRVNRKGYLGAFLMGLVSSIVFAPCGEPILLGILTWVAKTQSFFLGFWLLFVYAWGIGVLFFIIATFSSAIQYLPRAGAWMVAVKDFFGLLLFGLALFWLKFVLPESWLWGLATLYLLGVATFIQSKNQDSMGASRTVLTLAMLSALLLATVPLHRFALLQGWLPSTSSSSSQAVSTTAATVGVAWQKDAPLTDLARAKSLGKPVIVDYRTNVCPKCDELEHTVFSHPQVKKALEGFVAIQVNLSNAARNPEIREIQNRQEIYVVPVIEFYDSKGNLLTHKRIADVLSPDEFLKHINDIG
jgi:thiol:disulfide interchange protein DsbD